MFEHDAPETLEDYEYTTSIGPYTIYIAKVGGGTVGESYDGYWHYAIDTPPNGEPIQGSDLRVGLPITHEAAAQLVYEFATELEEE